MKQVYVDTNVILRFLTREPPDMAQQALALFTLFRINPPCGG
jgi:predicted nucleic acid-binding protein